MTSELVRYVEFEENPDPRCHFVLLVDTSGSMAGDKINTVNYGLQCLKTDLCDHEKARNSVELTIIKFDSQVQTLTEHNPPNHYMPPQLQAGGTTRLAAAVNLGLDLIEKRQATYRNAGVPFYAPWLWAITDGKPTDMNDIPLAAQRLRNAALDPIRGKTRIEVFMVGVDTPNDPFDVNILRQLSPQRDPVSLKDIHAFLGMFKWISQSLSAVSQSTPGEMVTLPTVTGWAKVGGG